MKRDLTLLKNELKLSIRDMNMVLFAVLMPLAVLVILGRPGVKFCVSVFRQGQEWRWKAGRILA